MKRSSIFILSILFLTFSSTAQIPNSDFEYWEPDSIYEKPVGWTTNNGEFPTFGVTKDTNSYSGNYAIRVASGNKNIHASKTNFAIKHHLPSTNGYLKKELDLQQPAGIYLITVCSNNDCITQKLMIAQ